MKVISPRKVEIKIKRPSGEVESLIHPKVDFMNDQLFAKFNDAMKSAGRGVGISYRNIDEVVEMEESDYQGDCERCGENLDTRKAYEQTEWTRFGGSKVRVKAHYCDSCKKVLSAMGELRNRASDVPSIEPTNKEG